MRLRFIIDDDFNAITCSMYDDTNEHTVYTSDFTFEEMRTFVSKMISDTFIDLPLPHNLRIKGNHKGQKILLVERREDCAIILLRLKRL